MKKLSLVLRAVLTFALSTFAVAIPLAQTPAAAEYQVSVKRVPFSYTTNGFLYNTASELQKAYNLNSLHASGDNGTGQTVVIVDAYGSPTIYDDLLAFVQWQNERGASLPWTSLEEVQSHLQVYYPLGKPAFNPRNFTSAQIDWTFETTLDVCMVHAVAPGADIALVVAPTPFGNALNLAVNYAVTNHLGSVISLSWGTPEYLVRGNNSQVLQADSNYRLAADPSYNITVFASTGDYGATNGGPFNNASFPASDPYVTAVGGTNLFMTCDNFTEGTGSWDGKKHTGLDYSYEIAGNDYEAMVADGHLAPQDIVTTGGAISTLFQLPAWQNGIVLTDLSGGTHTPTGRCTSDVSFDSGVYGGLGAVPYTAYPPIAGYYITGGTSASAPFWAALTAIANQVKGSNLGYINPTLYANRAALYEDGAFHDIAAGDNTFPFGGAVAGYRATRDWDAPTGIGSPDAAVLVPIMAKW